MITYFKGHCVESHGMEIPKKYSSMVRHILVECGGTFIQNPTYEGDTMVLNGIRFHSSKQYHEFERLVRIRTTDIVEVRNDIKKNYIKNLIRRFFRMITMRKGEI